MYVCKWQEVVDESDGRLKCRSKMVDGGCPCEGNRWSACWLQWQHSGCANWWSNHTSQPDAIWVGIWPCQGTGQTHHKWLCSMDTPNQQAFDSSGCVIQSLDLLTNGRKTWESMKTAPCLAKPLTPDCVWLMVDHIQTSGLCDTNSHFESERHYSLVVVYLVGRWS